MKILSFIKGIIKIEKEDLSFLQIGDIIWAKRYNTEREKSKIKKGHQESPYIIIKKDKKKVYALQCTSNPHDEIKWKMIYFPIGKFNYKMDKNTYVNCLKINELKKIQFVEIIGHLSDDDLNQLKKQLYILTNSTLKVKPIIEKKYLNFKLSRGDVITYKNNRYYINTIQAKEYETFRLRKHIRKGKSILINNTYYSFIFEKTETLKRNKKYDLVDTFNSGEVIRINQYMKSYMEKYNKSQENEKTLRVGTIIDYKDKLFYIYEIKENLIFAYRIFSNAKAENNIADISVCGGIYRTFFNNVELTYENLISNGYKIKRYANDKEIEYNKTVSVLPKSKRANKRKELSNFNNLNINNDTDNLVPMVIIKNKNNNKYYLIINKEDNIIEIVNVNDMGDLFCFKLENNNEPFEYYRTIQKDEFENYLKKIKEFKDMASMFNI